MILGIETSTTHASLALVRSLDEPAVLKSSFVSERAHNAVIFDPVTEMLAHYRDEITGIAVGLGPGSYGGVRVGIAVANGLSLVLGIPVLGVSSLEAWDFSGAQYTVLGDARRKTFFKAQVRDGLLEGKPQLLPGSEVIDEVRDLVARGDRSFVTADESVSVAIEGVCLSYPTAEGVAKRAMQKPVLDWPEECVLEPHYLRAPYITTPKAK